MDEDECGNQGEFIGPRVVCHDNLKYMRVRIPPDRLLPDRKQFRYVLFDGIVLNSTGKRGGRGASGGDSGQQDQRGTGASGGEGRRSWWRRRSPSESVWSDRGDYDGPRIVRIGADSRRSMDTDVTDFANSRRYFQLLVV